MSYILQNGYAGKFTPLVYNPYMWLDASELTTRNFTLVSSTHISSWNDISGNSRHVTQATDSKRPTLTNCTYYGQLLPYFNSNSVQSLKAAFNFPPQFTFCAVVVFNSYDVIIQPIVSSYLGAAFGEGEWMLSILKSSPAYWRQYYRPTNNQSAQIVKAVNNPFVITWTSSASQKVNLRVDETNVVAEGTTTTSTATQLLTLGTYNTGSSLNSSFNGWMAEIIFFNSKLADNHISRLERYLVQKWS